MQKLIEEQAELAELNAKYEALCNKLQKGAGNVDIRKLIDRLVADGVTGEDLWLAALPFMDQA